VTKYSFSGSGLLTRVTPGRPFSSYIVANDGLSSITIGLDDALFVLAAGETLASSPGERLGSFAVTLNASGVAWRFLADA